MRCLSWHALRLMASISIRIAGANGDGVESSGALLVDVAAKNGLRAFGYRGYQSIVRGGHVWYQVRIGDSKLRSHGKQIDILIALNQDAITYQRSRLGKNAIVIYDPSKTDAGSLGDPGLRLVRIPLADIALVVGGDPIMRNTVAVGAALRFAGLGIEALEATIRKRFEKKDEKMVSCNVQAAARGYAFEGVGKAYSLEGDGKRRYALDGNVALCLGAYAAGCKFYAAYPMTPASGMLHWFAAHESMGVVYKQTEDEIAAINMTIGAAVAGVRGMCGTSGGGFSLMVEGLGLAGMIEAPIVVVESQRTGPSTGFPTKTEQADLLFAMHASQGEFPRIVVAPSSVESCFRIAADAFNLADRYQVPVIILMDQYLSERIESVDSLDVDGVMIDRGKVLGEGTARERFRRYALSGDGISPRAFPGTKGREHVASSDEHGEYGDLLSDALAGLDESIDMRKKMHEKRMGKIDTMLERESVFVPEVNNEGANFFFVTFGSTTEAALEACEILKAMGRSFGVVSFGYLMPIDKKRTRALLEGKMLINVECNYTGQLAQVIMSNTGIGMLDSILKYDGEPFTGEEIAERALALTK